LTLIVSFFDMHQRLCQPKEKKDFGKTCIRPSFPKGKYIASITMFGYKKRELNGVVIFLLILS